MNRTSFHRQQRGMALLIALVVLIVVSILGATAMRSALFQNRISINTQLSQMMFQGAESGLQSVLNFATGQIADGIRPQDVQHLFYRALVLAQPQRICYGDDGQAEADGDVVRTLVGTELEFAFDDCEARTGSPLLVTAVVSEPPPDMAGALPIEGTNLCGNQSSCYGTAQIYSRAFASINNVPVRTSHVQMWGIVAPNANE